MDNMIFRLKRGESGAEMTTTLKENGAAVNLTTQNITAVRVVAKKTPTDVAVLDQACTIDTPVSGLISYAFNATTSVIATGEYLLEFRATDASGDVHYFPQGEGDRRNYGRLVVTAALG